MRVRRLRLRAPGTSLRRCPLRQPPTPPPPTCGHQGDEDDEGAAHSCSLEGIFCMGGHVGRVGPKTRLLGGRTLAPGQ